MHIPLKQGNVYTSCLLSCPQQVIMIWLHGCLSPPDMKIWGADRGLKSRLGLQYRLPLPESWETTLHLSAICGGRVVHAKTVSPSSSESMSASKWYWICALMALSYKVVPKEDTFAPTVALTPVQLAFYPILSATIFSATYLPTVKR